uniref:Uncharacterized protein n=1 Tax=Paracoccus aminophilus JCM 7686 TaxID=1367847 RepID=E7BLD8_PARAH|nr:hypothetical protein [Paracoccus aminophilus]ADF47143.1 hypothetical protein [Paracoccus aminophilus JCM 7686]
MITVMFDAVIAKKAKMEKILHDAKRNPREDLVTSSLFGVLRLLSPNARQAALSVLCDHPLPSDANIYLWPFFVGQGESAEPDVVLEFVKDGQLSFWIVEVKWGAPLGADQCAREIRTVAHGWCRRGGLPAGERRVLGYTLLGAEPQHQLALADLRLAASNGLGGVPAEGIRSLEWATAAENLRILSGEADDPGLKSWLVMSADFLSGQPQGSVLGSWPTMKMPLEGSFIFDDEEVFALPNITALPSTRFDFRE